MSQYIIIIYSFIQLIAYNSYEDYYKTMNAATNASHHEAYKKADSLFQEAVQLVEMPFVSDYCFAIDNAIKLKDFDKAFSYIKQAIQIGLSKERIEQESWFSQIEHHEKWFFLEEEYPILWEKYESQFDKELRQAVLEIYQRDQDFRLNGGENFDEENLQRLKDLIKEHGYLGYHKIGQDIELDMVFHHFLPEENEKHFYKVLKEAVFKGDISPYQYGAIIDYDQMKIGKSVIYGTYFQMVDGLRYLAAVENLDTLNKVRASIGLEPIEQFMERFNIIYDPNIIGF